MSNQTENQPFPFAAIKSCADKQPLACIEGTLTALYGRKTGTNSQGEWSIQNGEIAADGIKYPIFIKDRDELPSGLKNEKIRISSYSGQKGISGLYVMDDSHNGTTTRKIKITPTANIEQVAVSSPSSPQPQPDQPSDNDGGWPDENSLQQPAQQPAQKPAQKPAREPGVVKAKKVMMQLANCQILAAAAVVKVVAPKIKDLTGNGMTEEKLGNMITSLTLESWRKGLHCELPERPLSDEEI